MTRLIYFALLVLVLAIGAVSYLLFFKKKKEEGQVQETKLGEIPKGLPTLHESKETVLEATGIVTDEIKSHLPDSVSTPPRVAISENDLELGALWIFFAPANKMIGSLNPQTHRSFFYENRSKYKNTIKFADAKKVIETQLNLGNQDLMGVIRGWYATSKLDMQTRPLEGTYMQESAFGYSGKFFVISNIGIPDTVDRKQLFIDGIRNGQADKLIVSGGNVRAMARNQSGNSFDYYQYNDATGIWDVLKPLPESNFDKEYYYAQSPDVKQAGIDAYSHYIAHGLLESRPVRELFISTTSSAFAAIVPNAVK